MKTLRRFKFKQKDGYAYDHEKTVVKNGEGYDVFFDGTFRKKLYDFSEACYYAKRCN